LVLSADPTGSPYGRLSQVAWGDFALRGISPKGSPSAQTLCGRIRYHYRGNAEGSTLRLSLGCLLEHQLGTRLVRVGSGKRLTFAANEAQLSQWMEQNALVTWLAVGEPWLLERTLIEHEQLPLNLDRNNHHPFHARLSAIRRQAKERARAGPPA
jgi:hypothetical protein